MAAVILWGVRIYRLHSRLLLIFQIVLEFTFSIRKLNEKIFCEIIKIGLQIDLSTRKGKFKNFMSRFLWIKFVKATIFKYLFNKLHWKFFSKNVFQVQQVTVWKNENISLSKKYFVKSTCFSSTVVWTFHKFYTF